MDIKRKMNDIKEIEHQENQWKTQINIKSNSIKIIIDLVLKHQIDMDFSQISQSIHSIEESSQNSLLILKHIYSAAKKTL